MRIDLYRWTAGGEQSLSHHAALFIDGRQIHNLSAFTLESKARDIDSLTVTLHGDIHTHDGPPTVERPPQPTEGPERGPDSAAW